MALNRGRQLLAALLYILVPGVAGAQDIAPTDVWTGYRPTIEIGLPFAHVAELATVRIEATYIRDTETSLSALTTVLTADEPLVTDTVLLDRDNRLMQIETCRRQGLGVCPILTVGGSGSGFIDNGRRLYTCRHIVGDWPLAASLLNGVPVGAVLPPLIVRNRDGVLLYNSAYSANALRFEMLNDDPRLGEERILKYRALASRPMPPTNLSYSETLQYLIKASDFVAMQSDGDLIEPMPLKNDSAIAAGDRMYLSGFPAETDLLPKRYDGTPDKLLVSSVLTMKLFTPALPVLMAEGLQRPGGSGGMVTNADGEVIGMSCFADLGNAFAFSADPAAQTEFWARLRASDFADVLADVMPDVTIEAAALE